MTLHDTYNVLQSWYLWLTLGDSLSAMTQSCACEAEFPYLHRCQNNNLLLVTPSVWNVTPSVSCVFYWGLYDKQEARRSVIGERRRERAKESKREREGESWEIKTNMTVLLLFRESFQNPCAWLWKPIDAIKKGFTRARQSYTSTVFHKMHWIILTDWPCESMHKLPMHKLLRSHSLNFMLKNQHLDLNHPLLIQTLGASLGNRMCTE